MLGEASSPLCIPDQRLDNVKMYKYAKFEQNLPFGSRVMSVFKGYELTTTGRTDAQQSLVPVSHTRGSAMLKCISKQSLIKIYHAAQELSAFSLTDHGQTRT